MNNGIDQPVILPLQDYVRNGLVYSYSGKPRNPFCNAPFEMLLCTVSPVINPKMYMKDLYKVASQVRNYVINSFLASVNTLKAKEMHQ